MPDSTNLAIIYAKFMRFLVGFENRRGFLKPSL